MERLLGQPEEDGPVMSVGSPYDGAKAGNNGTKAIPEYLFSPMSRELLIGKVAVPELAVVDYVTADDEEVEVFVDLITNPDIVLPKRRFPRSRFGNWDMEDYTTYGGWLFPLVEPALDGLSHHVVLTRSYQLGAGPSRDRIIDPIRFVNVANFVRESGGEPHMRYGKFDGYTFDDYVAHIKNVIEEEGTLRITQEILWRRINEDGLDEPSPAVIRKNTGDLSAVLKAAGVRKKIRMTKEEYRLMGLEHMANNGGIVPSVEDQVALAHAGLAHHPSTIANHFGSWRNYQKMLSEAYGSMQPQEEQEAMELMKLEIETGAVPLGLFRGVSTASELVKRYARYKIASSLLPDGTDLEELVRLSVPNADLSGLISTLRRAGVGLEIDTLRKLIEESGFFRLAISQTINSAGWPSGGSARIL